VVVSGQVSLEAEVLARWHPVGEQFVATHVLDEELAIDLLLFHAPGVGWIQRN
jgi:hypothetical protein